MPLGASCIAPGFGLCWPSFLPACRSSAGWSQFISLPTVANPMPEKEYQRLTRARPRSRFAVVSSGSSSLWLGKDHVLCIDTSGYNESYKRFYFRDIQALVIRKTERQKWSALILAVLATCFLLPAGLSSEVVIKYVFGGIAGFFVLVLLIDLAL